MSVYLLLDPNALCRFCLQLKQNLSNIFEGNEDDPLAKKATYVACLEINDGEHLPRQTCEQCRNQINAFYEFKNMIVQSHKALIKASAVVVRNAENFKIEAPSKQTVNETENDTADCLQIILGEENEQSKVEEQENAQSNVEEISTVSNTLQLDKQEEEERDTAQNSKYPSMLNALKNNQCLLCLQKCTDRQSLQEHVDSHIAGTLLDPYYLVNDKHIFCRACKKRFKYRFHYLEHQRQHLNIQPFKCSHDSCGLSFYTNSTLKQHMSLHAAKKYVCATCGQGFKRKSELRCHLFIHQDDGKLYTCSMCFKQYKNRITLKAHSRTHVKIPMHKCPHCTKVYHSRSELCRHMFRHTQEKTFICNICNRSYYSKSALNRHLKEICYAHSNTVDLSKIKGE